MKPPFSQRLRRRITGFLLLQEPADPAMQSRHWKLSALRIILLFSLLQSVAIFLHSLWGAQQVPLVPIVVSLCLLAGLCLALYTARSRLRLGSWMLVGLVYAGGLGILNLVSDPGVARFGVIYFYAAPLLALLLLGRRAALGLMALNMLPFILLVSGKPQSVASASADFHIQTLLFLFFNIGIPLTLSRALTSLHQANRLARLDNLTGLPNRSYFIEILQQHIDSPRQIGKPQAVLNIKIRDMHIVNERYGIACGDEMIRQIAHSIEHRIRPCDRLGRTRGGAFSLLIAEPPLGSNNIKAQVSRYMQDLPRQHQINGQPFEIHYFVGATVFPQDADTADQLIRTSELAQHQARKNPTGEAVYYDPNHAAHERRHIDLEVALRRALRKRSLEMNYQPKVDHNGKLRGLEALVRWNSAELGRVSPAEFIPVAEKAGMVHEITLQMIEMVIRQIKRWQEQKLPVYPVSVNLSALDLAVPTLVNEIISRTYLLDLPFNLLEFEITETALMVNGEIGLRNLAELQKIGFRISIDDFGSGYSSLSQMANLPVYAIKIDREFVQGVPGDTRREKIIHGIISLAQSLDLSIVAEGVENAQQVSFLHARGCQLYQGFHFHHPLNAQQMGAQLQALRDDFLPQAI